MIDVGTATDGWRIYVADANSSPSSYTLVPNGQTINWGAWSALNAFTGKPIWQTADPTVGAIDNGPAIVDGVVYWGSG